jgi:hypothetical protein
LELIDFESIKIGAYTAPETNSSRSDSREPEVNPKIYRQVRKAAKTQGLTNSAFVERAAFQSLTSTRPSSHDFMGFLLRFMLWRFDLKCGFRPF